MRRTDSGTVSVSYTAYLLDLALKLQTRPEWLENLINFESGFKPGARNPYTGARGLIQFMPDTARALGYKDADDLVRLNPSIPEQLRGPVYAYLKRFAPFPTEQSLYMAVFYPAARNIPIDTPFSAKVQAVNPGIKTVRDYINKVRSNAGLKKLETTAAPLLLLMAAALFYYLIQRGKL